MPIKPENKARYPQNWPDVRGRILKRAGHRCEHPGCNARNYSVGFWALENGLYRWVPHWGQNDNPRTYTEAREVAAEPRARLARLRAEQDTLATQLQRLTDALLAVDGAAPATFVQRARDLEQQQADTAKAIEAAERDLAAVARTELSNGADDAWRALADGVEAQDEDARIRARQLVADTFERIVVYHHGMVPTETPPGTIDLVLLSKGGTARQLRINRTGTVLAAEQAAAG